MKSNPPWEVTLQFMNICTLVCGMEYCKIYVIQKIVHTYYLVGFYCSDMVCTYIHTMINHTYMTLLVKFFTFVFQYSTYTWYTFVYSSFLLMLNWLHVNGFPNSNSWEFFCCSVVLLFDFLPSTLNFIFHSSHYFVSAIYWRLVSAYMFYVSTAFALHSFCWCIVLCQ